jgi:hypothetical protein
VRKDWLPLVDPVHSDYHGEVLVEIVLMPLEKELDPDSVITMKIISCTELIAADAGGTSDPFAVITFRDQTKKTSTRFKTLNPQFDEIFEFQTHSTAVQELFKIELFDYDLVGNNDPLGHCFYRVGDLQMNKTISVSLPLRLRESANPLGEVQLEMLIKKLPEFFVSARPRSKSITLETAFGDLVTGMTKAPPHYTLSRKSSLGSSGIKLDCEATTKLDPVEEEPEVTELQRKSDEEMTRRRQWDAQYESELRHQTVEHNLKKGRNASGRCAFCGGLFTLSRRAVQCQVDHFWYHTWATRTVRAAEDTCYEQHKPEMKVRLRKEAMRDMEKDEEEMRRANWDREHEQEKLAQSNRTRLKRAVMSDAVGKLARRTRKGLDDAEPPYGVQIGPFPEENFQDMTVDAMQRRLFQQRLRADIATVINVHERRITVHRIDTVAFCVQVHIHADNTGKDRWTPEALAKKLVFMLVSPKRCDHTISPPRVSFARPAKSLVSSAFSQG